MVQVWFVAHAGTSLTYAEWAPLAPFTDSGLIPACAYFLNIQDFRLLACDILKQLSHRRQDKVGPASLMNAHRKLDHECKASQRFAKVDLLTRACSAAVTSNLGVQTTCGCLPRCHACFCCF